MTSASTEPSVFQSASAASSIVSGSILSSPTTSVQMSAIIESTQSTKSSLEITSTSKATITSTIVQSKPTITINRVASTSASGVTSVTAAANSSAASSSSSFSIVPIVSAVIGMLAVIGFAVLAFSMYRRWRRKLGSPKFETLVEVRSSLQNSPQNPRTPAFKSATENNGPGFSLATSPIPLDRASTPKYQSPFKVQQQLRYGQQPHQQYFYNQQSQNVGFVGIFSQQSYGDSARTNISPAVSPQPMKSVQTYSHRLVQDLERPESDAFDFDLVSRAFGDIGKLRPHDSLYTTAWTVAGANNDPRMTIYSDESKK
ncbi:hypothetical protein HK100_005229 [Physocladia obscura]|uniref:Uncharacterized protein n=1 Tax=Physocladia obscura TaxID=109957 RepID=A0AAD5SRW2_9FUNG|nr:hypothetical protein HK100_005229 [Physocladia obscura]